MSSAPAFASPQQALEMLHEAIGYLAAADPTAMPAGTQAEMLTGLEQLDAAETAARALLLAAFTAGNGHTADGAYSPRSWLIHQARITKGAAAGHIAWMRRDHLGVGGAGRPGPDGVLCPDDLRLVGQAARPLPARRR